MLLFEENTFKQTLQLEYRIDIRITCLHNN